MFVQILVQILLLKRLVLKNVKVNMLNHSKNNFVVIHVLIEQLVSINTVLQIIQPVILMANINIHSTIQMLILELTAPIVLLI